jgi:hypothetical protein
MWDALGIAAMVGGEARIRARCGCGRCRDKLELRAREGTLDSSSWLIHFSVPAARFWDDIGFT